MTKPDALTALEGKWMREDLCKCRAAGINPEAVGDMVKALEDGIKVANKFDRAHDIITHVDAKSAINNWRNSARAALAKAKLP
ncbi:hypothetical protein LCGC14_1185350 [marine sediment metagenome]|uniref:Uncharacterized protein n=1 Tax=marine sediment metagenome TaxID=412755 RepID=A0A0F9LQQ4_9ZZZZ